MVRRAVLVALLMGLLVSLALGRQGIVKTKDGRSIEGDITDKGADGVTVVTRGGSISLPRNEIASVDYAQNIQEAYQQRLARLPAQTTARDHIELARWLFEAREYQLARGEVLKALEKDPNSADAVALRQTIDRAALWDKRAAEAPRATPGASAVRPAPQLGSAAAGHRPERHLLDAEQINVIRQLELKEGDRPRVRFENNVVRRYVTAKNLDMKQVAPLPDVQKAMQILRDGSPDMRKDVKIISDPASLADFKARIQPIVLQGCATANCHGGVSAGNFILYSPAENEAVSYTNFYILSQYATDVDGVRRKMIDRTNSSKSLLVEFALPRDVAEYDHPEVPGWNGIFRGKNDPRYAQLVAWISQSLVSIEPDYNIAFPLPGGPSTRQSEQSAAPSAAPGAETPPAAAQPAPRQNTPGNEGPTADDALKDARQRMRPIRGL